MKCKWAALMLLAAGGASGGFRFGDYLGLEAEGFRIAFRGLRIRKLR